MFAEQQFFRELRLIGHGLISILCLWFRLVKLFEGLKLKLPVIFVRRLILLPRLSFLWLVPLSLKRRIGLIVKIVIIGILLPVLICILGFPSAVTVLSHYSGLDVLISSSMLHPVIFLIQSVGRLGWSWWVRSA